jgi:glucose uptake protein
MFIVETYSLAILFCVITMLCWGSWANTQKLAEKTWRFELYYWDYVFGIVLLTLLLGFTLGSNGDQGRSFIPDLMQASPESLANAFLGGVIFNLANILIVAAIAVAGMSVAFPVGIGLALVFGVLINYLATPKGDPVWLFLGVTLVVMAIVMDALAYRKKAVQASKVPAKGIILSVAGGLLMALFYRFVAKSIAQDFVHPEAGLMTPYTAVFVFSLGILISNLLFNTFLMKKPVEGDPVTFKEYFSGNFRTHLTGILGGLIWGIGMSFSILAAGRAGYAISYGLGQGATLVAALWGIIIWKEFKGIKGTGGLIGIMLVAFLAGLGLIVFAGAQ